MTFAERLLMGKCNKVTRISERGLHKNEQDLNKDQFIEGDKNKQDKEQEKQQKHYTPPFTPRK